MLRRNEKKCPRLNQGTGAFVRQKPTGLSTRPHAFPRGPYQRISFERGSVSRLVLNQSTAISSTTNLVHQLSCGKENLKGDCGDEEDCRCYKGRFTLQLAPYNTMSRAILTRLQLDRAFGRSVSANRAMEADILQSAFVGGIKSFAVPAHDYEHFSKQAPSTWTRIWSSLTQVMRWDLGLGNSRSSPPCDSRDWDGPTWPWVDYAWSLPQFLPQLGGKNATVSSEGRSGS